MTPEFYLFIGITATIFTGFLVYASWESMKSYVKEYVSGVQEEIEREIYRDMDSRTDEIYRSIEEVSDKKS